MDNKGNEGTNAKDLESGASTDCLKELSSYLTTDGHTDTLKNGTDETLLRREAVIVKVLLGTKQTHLHSSLSARRSYNAGIRSHCRIEQTEGDAIE